MPHRPPLNCERLRSHQLVQMAMSIPVSDKGVSVSEIVRIPSLRSGPCPAHRQASVIVSCRRPLITGGGALDRVPLPFSYVRPFFGEFLATSPRELRFLSVGYPSVPLLPSRLLLLDPSMSAPLDAPSGAGTVPAVGNSSRRLEPTPRPWATLPPFQKSRGSGDSTSSIELVPASAPPDPPVPDEDAVRGSSVTGERDDSTTKWFGSPLERSAPLPVKPLRFPWRRFACSEVTVSELLSHDRLRPDLLRVSRVNEAGGIEEASLMLGRLVASDVGAAYQIPDAIRSERTFAYSAGEVHYLDQIASYLSDPVRGGPRRFVLAAVPGLYVSPRPYAYSKARAAPQKSACSLM